MRPGYITDYNRDNRPELTSMSVVTALVRILAAG